MREINNNQNNLNFLKVETKKEVAQPLEAQTEIQAQPQKSSDLSMSPEAIIGRSQVQKSGRIDKTDCLENDIKMLNDNPKAIENAVNFFEIAYEQLQQKGAEHPYEKAAMLTHAFKEDFIN